MKLNVIKELLLGLCLFTAYAQAQLNGTPRSPFNLNTNAPIVSSGSGNGSGTGRNSQKQSGPPIFSSSSGTTVLHSVGDGSIAAFRNSLSPQQLESYRRIAMGAQSFGIDMMLQLSNELETITNSPKTDVMISPFAMWSLLLLIAEGADGETLNQLRRALYIEDHAALRRAYRDITAYLKANSSTVQVASMQAIFTDLHQPLTREYENTVERDYNATLIAVDFRNVSYVTQHINEEVSKATRGLIRQSVLPQDLAQAHMVLLSALYFKGQWRMPFDKADTRSEMFFGENGQELGKVDMMMQQANFTYAMIDELESFVLELPYGNQNRLSMIILLPKNGVRLNKVIHNLKHFGVGPIFERLTEASYGFEDELVEVKVPKFDTETDFNMHVIMQRMGVTDMFEPTLANLSKMRPKMFVSSIFHKTKIIVNEEGTEAGAIAGATLDNKSTPPKFHLNRPFIHLIIEKSTNVLLFTGQVVNPNKHKDG